MTLKVLIDRVCYKVVVDHYIILTLNLLSGNEKIDLNGQKNFTAKFFRCFFDDQYFFDESLTIVSLPMCYESVMIV